MMNSRVSSCLQAIAFILIFAGDVYSLTRGASRRNPIPREKAPRQAMESLMLLAERRECEPFSDVSSTVKNSANNDAACVADGCAGATSCCRVLTDELVCDADNEFAFFPCVCNDFTRSHRPTSPPVITTEPTSAPSRSPSTQQTDVPADTPTKAPTVGQEPTAPLSTSSPNSSPISTGGTSVPTNSDGVSQSTQQKEKEDQEDEDKRFTQMILGSAAAAILLMMAAIMLLVCRRKNQTEEPTKQEPLKLADLDELEQMEEDVDEIESETSDFDSVKSKQELSGKSRICCEDGLDHAADTCRDFSEWLGSACSPKRVRPLETDDTVQF
jgi:cell division septation protein DedD